MINTAGLFIINKNKELLIAHPTNHALSFWSIPKGAVDENEDELNAAIRETIEEVNVDLSKYNVIHKLTPIKYKGWNKKKKTIIPFVLFEWENPDIDFTKFELKCNSIVENGGFPEMDMFKFHTIYDLDTTLHNTQVEVLKEIKEKFLNKI